jgi:hypothetical protein
MEIAADGLINFSQYAMFGAFLGPVGAAVTAGFGALATGWGVYNDIKDQNEASEQCEELKQYCIEVGDFCAE